MKELSIIIVSYKGWDRLTKCLESLNAFTGKDFTSEVIIVDNNSGDDTILKFREKFSKFQFIQNPVNGGFGNGCNIGAAQASGIYLLFLNPDTVIRESELGKLLNTARGNPSFTILSCRQVNERGRESKAYGEFPELCNLTGFMRIFNRRDKTKDQSARIFFPDWVSGSVILMKKDSFGELRGFDEDIWMYYEDVDICKRVKDNNGVTAFCRDITIEHNHGGSSRINPGTSALTKTEVYISRHVYMSKHKRGAERVIIQVFLVINNIITTTITAVFGLLFFFIPGMLVRSMIFLRLTGFYFSAISRLSWISPMSVNNLKSGAF